MTTSPDTIERIVAELREEDAHSNPHLNTKFASWADRLEKLSAAAVQVTDEMVRAAKAKYDDDVWTVSEPVVREMLEAALRLSPQGEDHGR